MQIYFYKVRLLGRTALPFSASSLASAKFFRPSITPGLESAFPIRTQRRIFLAGALLIRGGRPGRPAIRSLKALAV